MTSCPEKKKKRQNLSKLNSDEAVLSLSIKRTDDKAENDLKSIILVHTKSGNDQ